MDLANRYADLICRASPAEIAADCTLGGSLVLERDRDIAITYAPFDYINRNARVVLVGITPGRQQATMALLELRRQLLAGNDIKTALERAKGIASFGGSMRRNLVDQLDYFGVNRILMVRSCASLFGADAELVHYTSALRYPVFVGGANYSGTPSMTADSRLRRYLLRFFAEEARLLRHALFVPLGGRVAMAFLFLADQGIIERAQILDGLQHPSGANAERIAYMLERKPKAALSAKTRADIIDNARASLRAKIAALLRAAESSAI